MHIGVYNILTIIVIRIFHTNSVPDSKLGDQYYYNRFLERYFDMQYLEIKVYFLFWWLNVSINIDNIMLGTFDQSDKSFAYVHKFFSVIFKVKL